jgi:hypothetical protein
MARPVKTLARMMIGRRPSRSDSRPSAGLPTGTVIGPPVSTAAIPRTTPSVELIATARTWLRPMCCCTSATR